MKKNGKKFAVLTLLAVVAVGSYFISGTYAKYTRDLSGSDDATVAKFAVSATGLNKEKNATISLFDTIKDDDLSTAETHVDADRIAPGTGGEFTTKLKNDSEVDVEAVVTITEEANASNVPIEYSLDGTTWKKASDNPTFTVNLVSVGETSGEKTKDVAVKWRWAYEGDDTTIGETTPAPTVKTKVTATFTQVD